MEADEEEEKEGEGDGQKEGAGEEKEQEVIGLILVKFNPVQPKQPMYEYEGARTQIRPQNKNCLN